MISLSVLILTFNSKSHIHTCLKSLISHYSQYLHNENIEIIVVDNASNDNTGDEVRKFIKEQNLSSIKFIQNKENMGFARGQNFAASKARGEFLLFLNPDAEIANNKIMDIITQFNRDKKIAVIGGKIKDYNNQDELSVGKFYTLPNLLLMMLGAEEVFGVRSSPQKICDVDFVSGGFMVVRKDLFEKIGGFDEKLFMYVEDMELCFRFKKKGLRIVFFPNAIINHQGQGSSSYEFAITHIYSGILYFYKKHKTHFELQIARLLLITKAKIAIMVGSIMTNKSLVQTYSKALQTIQ